MYTSLEPFSYWARSLSPAEQTIEKELSEKGLKASAAVIKALSCYKRRGKIRCDENIIPTVAYLARKILDPQELEKFEKDLEKALKKGWLTMHLSVCTEEDLKKIAEKKELRKLKISLRALMRINSSCIEVLQTLVKKNVRIRILAEVDSPTNGKFHLRMANLSQFCEKVDDENGVRFEGTIEQEASFIYCDRVRSLEDFKELENEDRRFLKKLLIYYPKPLESAQCALISQIPAKYLRFGKGTSFASNENDLNFLQRMPCIKTISIPITALLPLSSSFIPVVEQLEEKKVDWKWEANFKSLAAPTITPEMVTNFLESTSNRKENSAIDRLHQKMKRLLNCEQTIFSFFKKEILSMSRFKEFSIKKMVLLHLEEIKEIQQIPKIECLYLTDFCDEKLENCKDLDKVNGLEKVYLNLEALFNIEESLPLLQALINKGILFKINCKKTHFSSKDFSADVWEKIVDFAEKNSEYVKLKTDENLKSSTEK